MSPDEYRTVPIENSRKLRSRLDDEPSLARFMPHERITLKGARHAIGVLLRGLVSILALPSGDGTNQPRKATFSVRDEGILKVRK